MASLVWGMTLSSAAITITATLISLTTAYFIGLFDARKYEESIEKIERSREVETVLSCLYLAASQAAIGNISKAKKAIKKTLQHDPEATIEKWTQPRVCPYRNPDDVEHFSINLRKAGLAK